ncbi:hypothetical protein CY34DRAFT_178789 [Suillus luteus UH-Slu-Lm8-n1]|uniref:Uncharacterized protein n=1 Tax=Suillus luteus UH-Slu-Lm8-n1 TaxID=930992 RepID=A0A0D0B605_9AGAM|nr:hypothetical protein CY34DRAFT_178789 [Suillus luteus UH-Slu-Lm8-n1]
MKNTHIIDCIQSQGSDMPCRRSSDMIDPSVTGKHGHRQLESSNNGEDKEESHPSLLDVILGISEYKVKGTALGRQLVFMSSVHLPA